MQARQEGDDEKESVKALGRVAPVVSTSPRTLITKTAQRLHTFEHPTSFRSEFTTKHSRAGSGTCDPVLAFNQYLLSATDDGRVCVFDVAACIDRSELHSDVEQNSDPVLVAGPFDSEGTAHADRPAIVSVIPAPVRHVGETGGWITMTGPGSYVLGYVAVLTVEGDVHVLEFKCRPLKITKAYTLSTGLCGATSVAFSALHEENICLRICIGYETGSIFDWEITNTYTNASTRTTAQEKNPNTGLGSWDTVTSRLVWSGYFQDAVRSLAWIDSDSVETSKMNLSIAVCVSASDSRLSQTKGSRIEVLRTSSLEQDFAPRKTKTALTGKGNMLTLDLSKYIVWPEAGMEIMSAGQLAAAAQHQVPLSPYRKMRSSAGRGSDRICAFDRSSHAFAATLSDGRVALTETITSTVDATPEKEAFSWGVAHDANQLGLAYPCVGVGVMAFRKDDSPSDKEESSSCFACCLRGGTVYVVPMAESRSHQNADEAEIIAFPFQESNSIASSTNYVHGFTAGNIAYKQQDTQGTVRPCEIPVFVYSWGGGTMDVYVAGFLASQKVCQSLMSADQWFSDAVGNGSAELLLSLLCSLKGNDKILDEPHWREAWNNCAGKNENAANSLVHLLEGEEGLSVLQKLVHSLTCDESEV